MAIYDTRYGLTQPIVNYLNQGLPSISGIFSNAPTTTTPVVDDTEDTPTGLTPEQLALLYPQNVGGSGDGFSVYNPDPNKTRTQSDYSPYAMRQAYAQPDSDIGIPSGILSDSSFLYGEEPKGLAALANKAIDFIPGVGTMKKGAQFLGNMLGGIMPVNRRAILENELLGKGVMLDDIGRIVSNDYNTPEGIMSGYNANKLTDKSFQDRIDNISETLSEKYGMTQEEIDQAISGTYTGTKGFNPTMGKTTNLIGNLNDLFNAKNIFNRQNIVADTIVQNETRKKEEAARQKELDKRQAAADRSRQSNDPGNIGGGSYRSDRDNSNDGGYGGSSKRSADNRSSDLGFSDIRLKENVELIGKSPSNINIYKFNYKDNPTTYQGAMAHEVPWASIKNSNGYMMVDYNQIDVDFKKYNA